MSDFRNVDGAIPPHPREVSFNGKAVARPEARLERYVLNGNLPPDLFAQPK